MFDAVIWTNILLGVVQGLTEFLPISSSGHLILAREVFGVVGEYDLAFDALLHFATALAIVAYFWRDILKLLAAATKLPETILKKAELTENQTMVVALIAGTVPAVILGLLLEDLISTAFRNPLLIAATLVFGSVIMYLAEKYQGRSLLANSKFRGGWKQGLIIGLFQSLALIPGTSRSGMTISAGLLFGMERFAAARFGFLLGVPLLLGAGAKKALEIGLGEITVVMAAGVAAAFVVALLVIHFLLKFLRNHTLHIFIIYRFVLAFGIIILFL
ncbi:MAG: undecaprenyl-diphosphatase UppP [Candidatus Pacebacteria bacterium]|nr:undecaprenyl-diphosphatase UppP [Candidatus Paceibacterota bacterium]